MGIKKNSIKSSWVFIVFTILISLYSCFNNSERINKMANDALEDSVQAYKNAFNSQYQKIKQENHVDSNIIGFTKLRDTITELVTYVNRIENELHKFDENSTEAVRKIFIDDHIGDTIYNKLNTVFFIAKKYATSVSLQEYIKKEEVALLSDHDVVSWTNAFFGANTPIAVIWFLKGIQSEVYKIGFKSFSST